MAAEMIQKTGQDGGKAGTDYFFPGKYLYSLPAHTKNVNYSLLLSDGQDYFCRQAVEI
jgi:hypothetical protein